MFRVGLGQDCHQLVPGRPLLLGGVVIDHEKGLQGHSDADVLLHAVTDAIIGAVGRGDIGEWFPNTDPSFRGADSRHLLSAVMREVTADGWTVINIDCTINAERPKLSKHKAAIRESIAELVGISAELVNVKAKTGEKVGPVGREEAMTAEAVALLERPDAED
ncbi:2-C-methyl-D-erythritol 2,4-cyclodiphosphate synthase [Stratiformator vulcanicus]|uniref:2-C-methyl-D-erythritol 2,4-cyclodiphosphate synthase n=1 Tax=Stratiformator vulcanicus TaxID=2527980 RepID=A0A517R3S4_9PLAN|nr:2-C-methyl-D-erythritol 2,4-cyclodiphosphate synthase [Stratiformator vulcanicus]QDT38524.1 2-C-methyl-D-erythritol 2,4-cyclodiphosphate synthase [Stratiformator vulcanicus]